MNDLDAELIRRFLDEPIWERLEQLDVFAEIDSTNSYLMQSTAPQAGKINVAATSNQTAGRGRQGKAWSSPPGSGLCLSVAYTFARQPENLPALTLALGLGAISALEELGAHGIEIKWPNDLVAMDGKLGGILSEVQHQSPTAVTVVTGIGVNLDLSGHVGLDDESNWARRTVDLNDVCDKPPGRNDLAGHLITHLLQAFIDFEASGFSAMLERWSGYDWLMGRNITVDAAGTRLSGAGAGIAGDGALLIDTPESGIQRVTCGTIVSVGPRSKAQ